MMIQKTFKGQGDDCTAGFLLDYVYSDNNYRLIGVDLTR